MTRLERWITQAGALRRPGRPARPLGGREALVYGTYEPSLSTAGLLSAEESLDEYNASSVQAVTIPDGAVITSKIIHGRVQFAGTAELRDCLLVGPSTPLTSNNEGVVNCVNSRTGQARLYDCEIRPRQVSPGRNCILGGQFELYRCWLHEGEDGVGIYPASGGGVAADVKVMGCLIEDLGYAYPDRDHSDGSHPDVIQIQGGTGIEIVGNSLRGTGYWMEGSGTYYTANPTSYLGDWPLTKSPARAPGACLIIQNNTSSPVTGTILDGNYFHYGKTGLLIKSTANNFTVTNNRFSAINSPAANVNGTVYNGVTLGFTFNPYWIRFDNIAVSNNISGLVAGGVIANSTNVWLDGPSAGAAMSMPRASGIHSDA